MSSPAGGSWGYLDEAGTRRIVVESNTIRDRTIAPWSKHVILIIYRLSILRNPCSGHDSYMHYKVYADYDHGWMHGAQTNRNSVLWSLKQFSGDGKLTTLTSSAGVCPSKMHQHMQQFTIAILKSRKSLEMILAVFKNRCDLYSSFEQVSWKKNHAWFIGGKLEVS